MSYEARSELDDRGQVTRAEVAKLLESEGRLYVRLAIDVGDSPVTCSVPSSRPEWVLSAVITTSGTTAVCFSSLNGSTARPLRP
jgi:hypothetical protein